MDFRAHLFHEFLRREFAPGQTIAVVGHGAFFRSAFPGEPSLTNCEFRGFDIDAGGGFTRAGESFQAAAASAPAVTPHCVNKSLTVDEVLAACQQLNGSMAKVAFVEQASRHRSPKDATAASDQAGQKGGKAKSSSLLSNTFKNATSKIRVHQTQSLSVYPSKRGCSLVSKNAFDYSSYVLMPACFGPLGCACNSKVLTR